MTKVAQFGIDVLRMLGSFIFAWRGLRLVLAEENNARVHALCTVASVGAGFALRISLVEWGVLTLLIGLVWVAEILNTAIERLVDLVSPEHNLKAGNVKDIAAGAVLVAAIAAVIGGMIIFGGKLWVLLALPNPL